MIDLHLHSTCSDGRSSPAVLVDEAAAAGIRIMAITDHDTVAGAHDVQTAAQAAGLRCIVGIEITAVYESRDVHMLGYFVDPGDRDLLHFLETQRADRVARVHAICSRLEAIGLPIDVDRVLAASAGTGKAVGRPAIARAMVEAGHVPDIAAAFDRFLADGQAAFVPRGGPSPADVVDRIGRAGGVASIAHPGKLRKDEIIAPLVRSGMTAIEAYHPDHSEDDTRRYLDMAHELGALVTGGSDYHGTGSGRVNSLGKVTLPADRFDALVARAGHAAQR